MIALVLIRAVQAMVTVFTVLIIVRVLLSWFQPSGYSPFFQNAVGTLDMLTEWILGPVRNVVPQFGGLDWSPFIALILLQVAGDVVTRILAAMV